MYRKTLRYASAGLFSCLLNIIFISNLLAQTTKPQNTGIPDNSGNAAAASFFEPSFLKFVAGIENPSPAETLTAGSFNLKTFPNPFRDNTTISFTLNEISNLEIFVIDLSGRIVEKYTCYNLASGKNEIALHPGNNLAPGEYLIKLKVVCPAGILIQLKRIVKL